MDNIPKTALFRHRIEDARRSPFSVYRDLVVGDETLLHLLHYELVTSVFGPMPGALGLLLRRKTYPSLFKSAGRGIIIGRSVTIRHPRRIALKDNVTIDDYAMIDARGSGSEGIVLEDNVIVNRSCTVQAKNGSIRLGRNCTIGSHSAIVSLSGIDIGNDVMLAGGCSISAGFYGTGLGKPLSAQGPRSKGPIVIGDGAWIGTGAIILDAVSIGPGAVVGAGSVVTRDIPENCIAAGVPAKVLRERTQTAPAEGL